jgi:nucleoside phosphorylase
MPPKRRAHEHDANTPGSLKRLKSNDSEDEQSTAAQERFSNEDYTVGWICAINPEYVAAQSFLDEEHDRSEYIAPNDSNDYTLGRIGKHNVVIAVLPKGEYGIASAANVASRMLFSFKNVRLGLMVGIGGGAPSHKHDIRLGDIVVSTPYNKEGGVIQYDFGKAIQDKEFKVTGHLNQPPVVFRTAVSGLEAQYERHGHQFEDAFDVVFQKNPRLRNKYKRPDPNTDKLYESGVIHPNDDEARCAEACDPTKLIHRKPRTEDEDNPAIHYGIVASANTLMKNALLRDKFAKEHDVLCFEMEAAGLMNNFPCLVIRGICDYSDSHKNKEWQGYAAMAAAAYARDLLARIPITKVKDETKINDVLHSGMSA